MPVDRPLIGITGKRVPSSTVQATPVRLLSVPLDSHYASYAEAVADAGGLPVHLPREADAELLIARLDGLLVSGGQDVDPRTYGGEARPDSPVFDPGRDAFEVALIRAALEQGVTVLGICRGSQLINIARGGTLHGDLEQVQGLRHDLRGMYPNEARTHAVEVTPGSRVHAIYGERIEVNSFHHQGVDRVGADVVVSGRAPDGIVEAIEIEAPAGAIGVQWHPEVLGKADPIFEWLVSSAAAARESVPVV